MGQQTSQVENDEKELEVIDQSNAIEPVSYQDAVVLASDYLRKLTVNDGTSEIVNKVDLAVTNVLSHALNFPAFVEYPEEDEELVELIRSFAWIQPEDLQAAFDIKDLSTLSAISDAVHSLAVMTTRSNAFEMLACLVDCCKHSMTAAVQRNRAEGGADDLLPAIIYVVLKSNPPKLYSHLKFISNFLTINESTLNNGHRLSSAVPRLFGTVVDCCFTNIQIAVTTINNMEAFEEKKMINYGSKKQIDYLSAQYTNALNQQFEDEFERSFVDLEDGLNRLISVRRKITDKHRDDMIAIADKLDGNKRNAHVAKAVGLLAAIGGGIISIVGFGLMFTTFGATAVLIPLGASLGGVGGLTASISGFVEYGIKRSTAKDINLMREDYETVVNEVFKSLKQIEETINNVWKWYHIAGKTGKSVIVLVDIVVKLARLVVAIDNVSDIGVNAFRAAGAAGRGLAIAGLVINVILLPIDMVFFGISIKKLKDNEKSEQANIIRAWLDQGLPDKAEITGIVGRLKATLLEFVADIKNGGNAENLDDGELKLKNALEEIKSMIEQNIT